MNRRPINPKGVTPVYSAISRMVCALGACVLYFFWSCPFKGHILSACYNDAILDLPTAPPQFECLVCSLENRNAMIVCIPRCEVLEWRP